MQVNSIDVRVYSARLNEHKSNLDHTTCILRVYVKWLGYEKQG